MTKKASNEFLLVLASSVVIVAALLIIGKGMGWWSKVGVQVAGARTEYSPAQLMKQLQGTVDDGGANDLLQLKNEASGL
jgi:hypothetical protein